MKDRLTGRPLVMSNPVQKRRALLLSETLVVYKWQILNEICKANNLLLDLSGQTEVLALVLYAVDDDLVFECAPNYLDYVFERLFVNQF